MGHHAGVATTGAFPAGWFPDPSRRHVFRFWDGQSWTAWVADAERAFLEDASACRVDARRSWRASSLLWGTAVGSTFGAGLLIAAFSFPHSATAGAVQIGTSQRLGGVWLAIVLSVLVGIGSAIVYVGRTHARLTASPRRDDRATDRRGSARSFAAPFAIAFAVGAISALPTWIQGWPAIFACVLLAGLTGAALLATSWALRLRGFDQSSRTIRCQSWLSAMQGLFVSDI
jgi:MFS family permease